MRNGTDALFAYYDIKMVGIEEVQVMEYGTRQTSNTTCTLEECVVQDAHIAPCEIENWQSKHNAGIARLNRSPRLSWKSHLSQVTIDYCVCNVEKLPRLYDVYNGRLGNRFEDIRKRIEWATEEKVAKSWGESHVTAGPDNVHGPWWRDGEGPGRDMDSFTKEIGAIGAFGCFE